MTVTGWGRITNNQTATELNYAEYNSATDTLRKLELEVSHLRIVKTFTQD